VTKGIVLVHGGQHTGRCWEPTVAHLMEMRPEISVLPVHLPGRDGNPADLSEVGIAECVQSVVSDIERAKLSEVVLVAHSMGGVTIPGVAEALGKERVSRLVFIAAAVPPDGTSILEDLIGELRETVGTRVEEPSEPAPFPREMVTELFCNGMTEDQVEFTMSQMCPESNLLATQRVDRSGMPQSIPRTWILTARDRAVTPEQQRQHIENLGGVDDVVEIDTCHDVMISEPEQLAKALVDCL
jgi:pimeloyl-ACP methyl ester carboxylesterase